MPRFPRYVPQRGALVEVTYRTVQGRYLLRPGSVLNDTVVGVLARALRPYPRVGLVGIVVLSNHLHLLLTVKSQEDLSKVMARFASKSAREINKIHGWSGSLWGDRYRSICVTEEPAAQIRRLEYLLSQAVKEGLVARVKDWPGIHFGKTLLQGRSLLAGTWVDRTKKYRKGAQGKEVRREEYTSTHTVELQQLPCWAHLHWGKYLERIREMIRKVEEEAALERELRGVDVVGAETICLQDPQTWPNEVKSSPAPLVHAASKRARLAWREVFGWFLTQYREASKLLRQGDRSARFPEGCFPPGLPFVGAAGGLPLQPRPCR